MTGTNGVTITDELIQSIPGNAPLEVKGLIRRWLSEFGTHGFGTRTAKCLDLVEVSITTNPDEPAKQEARIVLETTVNEDMLNVIGRMHGACIAHFVDLCTTLPIIAMSFVKGGKGSVGVSQNISIMYHAPANLGDRLRLINTSMNVGSSVWSARIEIWDVTHHRLVASATQVKMEASPPKKLSPKL